MKPNYYITTTAPYVNAKPHIGFALEIIHADTIARYKRLTGHTVFFNFGTDEHGQKIYEKAKEQGIDPQAYTDEYAAKFDLLKSALNLSYDKLTRTTDPHHKKAAQKMWTLCKEAGFIEKGVYKAKYCVGCELEKQDSELVDGKCPLHPTGEIQLIEEENYFFKFSKLQEKLIELYKKYPDFVVPSHRLTEIRNFVEAGLADFSISRLREKMPWGVPVPDDENHVMYVWFDALTYYISSLGWPEDTKNFEDFWGTKDAPQAVQFAGKDNLRQQSAMWQAMLLAAGLPTSRQILIHGFITSGGQKMSKSIGNVIDPIEYVEKYGTDAVRYYLLAKISPVEDSDLTTESFEQVYQADLANGLGNLVSRILGLAEGEKIIVDQRKGQVFFKEVESFLNNYEFNQALDFLWRKIREVDTLISEKKVWELTGEERTRVLGLALATTRNIAHTLSPFLPATSEKILDLLKGPTYKKTEPLFLRLT